MHPPSYLFDISSGAQIENLRPSDGASWEGFGTAVAISASQSISGARHDDDNGSSSGSAYIFTNPTTDPGTPYCFGDGSAAACPCGNMGDSGAGCQNSSGAGATLWGSGSASVSADDLFLAMAPIPVNEFGLFFTGTGAIGPFPFGDGLRCVGGSVFRFPILNAGSAGTIGFGQVVGFSNSVFGPGGQISVGSTWNYQGWYRDPNGACSSSFNLTNGMAITYGP